MFKRNPVVEAPCPGPSNAGSPEGGGSVDTPTNLKMIPMMIILNIHNWKKKIFTKICPSTQAPISQGPTRRTGRGHKILFCGFHRFLNSPQNSELFEYRHKGSKNFPLLSA